MKLRSGRERHAHPATEPRLLTVGDVSFRPSVALGRREGDRWYGAKRRQKWLHFKRRWRCRKLRPSISSGLGWRNFLMRGLRTKLGCVNFGCVGWLR